MNQRNIQGELKYPNLRKVIGCFISLPFANAPEERLFSAVNRIKNEYRHSLKRESLVALLHAKEGLATTGKNAHQLNLSDFPKLLKLARNIKSNATDTEAHEIIKRHNMENHDKE